MSMSYEEILQGMLNRVPSTVDKREGSIIYDALAPCAYFLAQQNFQLDNFIELVFPDTAVGEYLDHAVAGYGIVRKPASAAVRKMITSEAVNIGSRWGIRGLVYVTTEKIAENVYRVVCEVSGEKGNQYSGKMDAISNEVIASAILGDIITPGNDEESDEAMRRRFYAKVQLPATSGNAYHYQQWALEVPGVGASRVFPLDNGPGTVTVLIVDEEREISSSLEMVVAAYIEEVRPIGATVTVISPEVIPVTVSANIILDGSRTLHEVKTDFEQILDQFLKELIFTTYRVSYAKLGSLLLDVPGVADFEGLLLNSSQGNVIIGEKQIPVKSTVTLLEVEALAIN